MRAFGRGRMADPKHPRRFTDELKRQIVDPYNAGKLPKTGDSLPLAPPLACLVGAALTAAGAALMARRPDGSASEKSYEGEEEGE